MKFSKVFKGGMVAAMAMSLVACSSNSTTSAKSTSSSAEAFKIGGSGPLSGDAAVYGNAVKNGAELAVKEINAKGKVQLEFKYEDDQADGEKAATAYNTLADWGMQASIGATTSGLARQYLLSTSRMIFSQLHHLVHPQQLFIRMLIMNLILMEMYSRCASQILTRV